MTDIAALDRLIEAVEAGVLGWNGIANTCEVAGIGLREAQIAASAYHGSLDAAKALHEALLPGLLWEITPRGNCYIRDACYDTISRAVRHTENPARAWLLAVLKALRNQHET